MTSRHGNDWFASHVDDKGNLTPHGEDLIIDAFEVLAEAAWRNSEAHGFHQSERPFSEEVALWHSECSEALEEWRDGRGFKEVHYTKKINIGLDQNGDEIKAQVPAPQFNAVGGMNKPEGIGAEAADVAIRLADSDRQHGLNLGERIVEKHRFNVTRPFMNGGKIA